MDSFHCEHSLIHCSAEPCVPGEWSLSRTRQVTNLEANDDVGRAFHTAGNSKDCLPSSLSISYACYSPI